MSLSSLPKKALLVGINYNSIPQIKLNGCISDIINMSNTLQDAFNYSSSDITMLRDDVSSPNMLPTRQNILNNLNNLINQSANYSEIWFHYSGHGSQIRDLNGDEVDKLDEVIVPLDYSTKGFITDDEVFNIVKNSKCRTILLFDSCHSGTMCDLQYIFNYNSGKVIGSLNGNKSITTNPNIICFSGCRDSQTSADVYLPSEARSVGAFTASFLAALRRNRINVDIMKLYSDLCTIILSSGFSQIPTLSCSTNSPNYVFQRSINSVTSKTSPNSVVLVNTGTTTATKDLKILPIDLIKKIPDFPANNIKMDFNKSSRNIKSKTFNMKFM